MSACYRCWTGCGFGWRVRRRAAKITASVSRRRTSYSLCRRPRFAEFSASPAVPPPSRRSAAFCPVRASRLNQSIDRSISQSIKGVPRIFHWRRGKPKAGSGGGVIRERTLDSNPSPPAGESGGALEERCELPQRGSGRRPGRPKVFHYFQHSGWPLLVL